MTEEQISRDISLGESAKAVIENEAYSLAYDALVNELTSKWQNSPVKDADGREKLFLMLTLCKAMKANLDSMILSGKMAQEERRRLSERLKDSWAALTSGNE